MILLVLLLLLPAIPALLLSAMPVCLHSCLPVTLLLLLLPSCRQRSNVAKTKQTDPIVTTSNQSTTNTI